MTWDGDTILLAIGNALLIIGIATITMFGLLYSFSAPWWRTLIGWMFVAVSFAVTTFGITVLLGTFLGPEYPGRGVVRIIGYGCLAAAGVVLLTVYLIERRRPATPLPRMEKPPVFVPPLVRLWRRFRGTKPPTPTGGLVG